MQTLQHLKAPGRRVNNNSQINDQSGYSEGKCPSPYSLFLHQPVPSSRSVGTGGQSSRFGREKERSRFNRPRQ